MNISQFLRLSLGQWRSQRTGHSWDGCEVSGLDTRLDITPLQLDSAAVVHTCQQCDIDPATATFPFQVVWTSGDRSHETATANGAANAEDIPSDDLSLFIPIPKPENANYGRMIQAHRNSSSPVLIGQYRFNPDGTLVLTTEYPTVLVEEKIWFATPNLRLQAFVSKPKLVSDRATIAFISENRIIAPVNSPR